MPPNKLSRLVLALFGPRVMRYRTLFTFASRHVIYMEAKRREGFEPTLSRMGRNPQ